MKQAPHRRVPDLNLAPLTSTMSSNLSNNRLTQIDFADIRPLVRLKMLWLSYNRFRCELDLETLGKMQGLLLMHLEGCFWCNTSARDDRQAAIERLALLFGRFPKQMDRPEIVKPRCHIKL